MGKQISIAVIDFHAMPHGGQKPGDPPPPPPPPPPQQRNVDAGDMFLFTDAANESAATDYGLVLFDTSSSVNTERSAESAAADYGMMMFDTSGSMNTEIERTDLAFWNFV